MRWLVVLFLSASLARAEGEAAGAFDYYVLSLSWSANWCAREGDARGAEQCDAGRALGWTLHGLWPQYEAGWPSYCPTTERNPSRAETAQIADIMGSSGLAWHQWNKHGRCSGLSAADYYALSRLAYETIDRPGVFRRLRDTLRLPASVVEDAFLAANPTLGADQITITCADGYIQEARICLSRDLEPRTCGRDVIRDCSLDRAVFAPVR